MHVVLIIDAGSRAVTGPDHVRIGAAAQKEQNGNKYDAIISKRIFLK
jgi:hypothetical protein